MKSSSSSSSSSSSPRRSKLFPTSSTRTTSTASVAFLQYDTPSSPVVVVQALKTPTSTSKLRNDTTASASRTTRATLSDAPSSPSSSTSSSSSSALPPVVGGGGGGGGGATSTPLKVARTNQKEKVLSTGKIVQLHYTKAAREREQSTLEQHKQTTMDAIMKLQASEAARNQEQEEYEALKVKHTKTVEHLSGLCRLMKSKGMDVHKELKVAMSMGGQSMKEAFERVEQLEAEVDGLKQDVARAKASETNACHERDTLQMQHEVLSKTTAQHLKTIVDHESRYNQLQLQYRQTAEELATTKQSLDDTNEHCKTAQHQLEALQHMVQHMSSPDEILQELVNEKHEQLVVLQRQHTHLEQNHGETSEQVQTLQNTCQALEEKCKTLERERDDIVKHTESHINAMAQAAHDQERSLKSAGDKVKEELTELQEKYDVVIEKKNETEQRLQETLAEKIQIELTLAEREEQHDREKEDLQTQHHSKHAEKESAITVLNADLKRLRHEIEATEANLQQQLREAKEHHDAEAEKWGKQRQEMQKSIDDSAKSLEEVNTKLETSETSTSAIIADLEQAKNTGAEELKTSKSENAALRLELMELESCKVELETQVSQHKENLSTTAELHEAAAATSQALQAQTEQLQQQCSDKDVCINETQEKVVKLAIDVSKLQQQKTVAENEVSALQSKLLSLQEDYEHSQLEAAMETARLETLLKKHDDIAEKRFESLKKEHQKYYESYLKQKEETDAADAAKKLKDSQNRLNQTAEQVAKLAAQLQEQTKTASECQTKLRATEQRSVDQTRIIQKQDADMEALQEKMQQCVDLTSVQRVLCISFSAFVALINDHPRGAVAMFHDTGGSSSGGSGEGGDGSDGSNDGNGNTRECGRSIDDEQCLNIASSFPPKSPLSTFRPIFQFFKALGVAAMCRNHTINRSTDASRRRRSSELKGDITTGCLASVSERVAVTDDNLLQQMELDWSDINFAIVSASRAIDDWRRVADGSKSNTLFQRCLAWMLAAKARLHRQAGDHHIVWLSQDDNGSSSSSRLPSTFGKKQSMPSSNDRRISRENHYMQAVHDLTEAIGIDGCVAYWWSERGILYCKLKRNSHAHGDFEKAISLGSGISDTYALRGQARYMNSQISEAHDDFERAIELNPSIAEYYAQRAAVMLRLRPPQTSKAAQDLTAAIHLSPHSPTLYRLRGKVFAVTQQWNFAASDFTSVLTLTQHAPQSRDLICRGKVYALMRQWRQAAMDFRGGCQLDDMHRQRRRSSGGGKNKNESGSATMTATDAELDEDVDQLLLHEAETGKLQHQTNLTPEEEMNVTVERMFAMIPQICDIVPRTRRRWNSDLADAEEQLQMTKKSGGGGGGGANKHNDGGSNVMVV